MSDCYLNRKRTSFKLGGNCFIGDGNVCDALSAKQGYVLYEMITNVEADSGINEIFGG